MFLDADINYKRVLGLAPGEIQIADRRVFWVWIWGQHVQVLTRNIAAIFNSYDLFAIFCFRDETSHRAVCFYPIDAS